MFDRKIHYIRCDECGWRCNNHPPELFYISGDHCKECGNELTNYNFLYEQADYNT